MMLDKVKKLNIPASPGVYQFKDSRGEMIYIGKAANLKLRVLSYWQKSANHTSVKFSMLEKIAKISWIETDSEIEALLLEANLIKKYQPYFNVLLRDDKRFAYIKISLADAIPGVFITRKIDKSGKYFGPFTAASAARETLRAIRKIFPYCTMRRIHQKPCFYYQIGLCLGICADKISRDDYIKQVIRPLVMFLEGKKGKIIKQLEVRIKKLEKNQPNGRELADLKYELKNMKQVLAGARVLSVGEKYANDVVELAKLLNLPRVPQRIEGYDISNIFGRQAVGSMVVFSGGEPAKSEYRKFKIRLGQGEANDVKMLKEILERRFKHLPPDKGGIRGAGLLIKKDTVTKNNPPHPPCQGGKKENWPLPDLIIVDGGKAQLNAVYSAVKKINLKIPVIAISKGNGLRSAVARDKLFFVGEKKPLELPLASPALHLIKRVRDEAHRFAVGYHRKLRNKKLF